MYYYRGTRKGTGREVWEQRAYKDYKTGAWMEVKEPRIINGKQVVYRVGRDKFGQEYKELGGTIIQHGPEGKPEFIPASFYRRNYVQKVAEGGIDLKYDRDTTRATMFKLTAGRQEFESIELDESIASLAGRTLVRKEPQVIKNGTVYDGRSFTFPRALRMCLIESWCQMKSSTVSMLNRIMISSSGAFISKGKRES